MDSASTISQWFSSEYHGITSPSSAQCSFYIEADLNGGHIEIYEQPPTALEFSRLVHINRPVLIRGTATRNIFYDLHSFYSQEWKYPLFDSGTMSISLRPWTPTRFLLRLRQTGSILVCALGPSHLVPKFSRADAVTRSLDGKLYFVEPHIEKMKMSELLSKLSRETEDLEIYYLQSQNGNVYSNQFFEGKPDPSEFESLRPDIPSEIPWCSEGLGKSPDAVNLWIGSHNSVTSIHSDPYENIYTVVRGSKHFTLLPPTDGWCLKERMYPHGIWRRSGTGLTLTPSPNVSPIRWSSVADPDIPGKLPQQVHPIQLTVVAGETLYLPAGWWHHVRQADNTIALNWWYDMEMRGMAWIALSFLRGVGDVPSGNDEADVDEGEDDCLQQDSAIVNRGM
ncbi:Jmjc domain-containing protein 7 [Mycena venus]|uniref:Jmjc domain-containing protein 7 n=1 Tax=Mycena venus TaxID=2733690 RepID=A0A8H6Y5X1_9AGAR|nr:Jmjc domain-containing protein 7 [Mycena venus]